MDKKFSLLCILLLVTLLLSFTACGETTTTTTSTPSTTVTTTSGPTVTTSTAAPTTSATTTSKPATTSTTSAPTTSASTTAAPTTTSNFKIELIFPVTATSVNPIYTVAFLPWTQEITKRTGGRVTFKMYLADTLVKGPDQYDAVVKGVADIAMTSHGNTAGRFPLFEVFSLPLLATGVIENNTAIVKQVYKDNPEMQAEHSEVHILDLTGTTPQQIHTVKKPVRALQDMKGLRLAAPGAATYLPPGLGAIPIQMAPSDFYSALDKGVVDGIITPFGAVNAMGLNELTHFHTICNLAASSQWCAMNINTWNKLPPDIQQVFNDLTITQAPYWPAASNLGEKLSTDAANKLGYEIIRLSPDEMSKWFTAAGSAWDKWVAEKSAAGISSAQAVLDETFQLVQKYNQEASTN